MSDQLGLLVSSLLNEISVSGSYCQIVKAFELFYLIKLKNAYGF